MLIELKSKSGRKRNAMIEKWIKEQANKCNLGKWWNYQIIYSATSTRNKKTFFEVQTSSALADGTIFIGVSTIVFFLMGNTSFDDTFSH